MRNMFYNVNILTLLLIQFSVANDYGEMVLFVICFICHALAFNFQIISISKNPGSPAEIVQIAMASSSRPLIWMTGKSWIPCNCTERKVGCDRLIALLSIYRIQLQLVIRTNPSINIFGVLYITEKLNFINYSCFRKFSEFDYNDRKNCYKFSELSPAKTEFMSKNSVIKFISRDAIAGKWNFSSVKISNVELNPDNVVIQNNGHTGS